jgi:hypothetical protein
MHKAAKQARIGTIQANGRGDTLADSSSRFSRPTPQDRVDLSEPSGYRAVGLSQC